MMIINVIRPSEIIHFTYFGFIGLVCGITLNNYHVLMLFFNDCVVSNWVNIPTI